MPWQPSDLGSKLKAYWIPDDPSSAVANIPNLEGTSARDFPQGTASFQAVLEAGPVAGINVLHSDGSNDRYQFTDAAFVRPFEVHALIAWDSDAANSTFAFDGKNNVSATIERVSSNSVRSSFGDTALTHTFVPDITVYRMYRQRGGTAADSTENHFSINGYDKTNNVGTTNPGGATLFARGGLAAFGKCRIAGIFYTDPLTDAEAFNVRQYLWPYANLKGVLIAVGDSITAGGVGGATSWADLLSATVTDRYEVTKVATAGWTLYEDILPTYSAEILARTDAARPRQPIVFVFAGTNDEAEGRTDAQIIADFFDACDQSKASGAFVVAVSPLPRTDRDFTAIRAGIAAEPSHYEAYVDGGSFPDWNAASTLWQADHIHLTTAGGQAFATYYAEPAIAELLVEDTESSIFVPGVYAAGISAAGFGPASALTNRFPSAPTLARRLKAPPLDYELDANGRWIGTHSVDQGVALSLTVEQGAITSAPSVGQTLRQVVSSRKSTASDVEDRVRNAFPLSRYLTQGDVELLEIRHEEVASGGLKVDVRYRNTRTSRDHVFRLNQ